MVWWESYKATGIRGEVKCIKREGPEHTNAALEFRYEAGAVYRNVAKPSTTLLALTTAIENPDNTMPRK